MSDVRTCAIAALAIISATLFAAGASATTAHHNHHHHHDDRNAMKRAKASKTKPAQAKNAHHRSTHHKASPTAPSPKASHRHHHHGHGATAKTSSRDHGATKNHVKTPRHKVNGYKRSDRASALPAHRHAALCQEVMLHHQWVSHCR